MKKNKIISNENKKYNFPPERELKRIREKKGGIINIVLPKNATFLEKIKYEICQAILTYQQDKRLTYEKIAKKLGISSEQTIDMLRGNIASFALDSLINYAEKLSIPYQVKVMSDDDKWYYPLIPKSSNGRLRKHA